MTHCLPIQASVGSRGRSGRLRSAEGFPVLEVLGGAGVPGVVVDAVVVGLGAVLHGGGVVLDVLPGPAAVAVEDVAVGVQGRALVLAGAVVVRDVAVEAGPARDVLSV